MPVVTERTVKVKNWKHIRAMHLLLISIIERSSQNDNGRKSSDFNDPNDFEYSIILWNKENGLLMLDASVIDQRYKLMFPEYGFCPIVVFNKRKQTICCLGSSYIGR